MNCKGNNKGVEEVCYISEQSFSANAQSVTSYYGGRGGFVKQISLPEQFLELLLGTHDRHRESLEAEDIGQRSLTMVSCFWKAVYGDSTPLNVLGKHWLK